MTLVEFTIRNLAENIFDMAVGVEMAEPVATWYLHALLNMVPNDKAEKIIEALPGITETCMKKALDHFQATHA